MSIKVHCKCGRAFRVKEQYAGTRTTCPACRGVVVVEGPRVSSHDVFVSYSAADKAAAEAVCAALEKRRIRCWMAPRNIAPGADWGSAIVEAITGASVFVLLFSEASNRSKHVLREAEQAVSRGLSILPVRLDSTEPSGGLSYFIGVSQWFDASKSTLDASVDRLSEAVEKLTSLSKSTGFVRVGPPPRDASPKVPRWKTVAAVAGAVLSVGLAGWMVLDFVWPTWRTHAQDASPPIQTTAEPSGGAGSPSVPSAAQAPAPDPIALLDLSDPDVALSHTELVGKVVSYEGVLLRVQDRLGEWHMTAAVSTPRGRSYFEGFVRDPGFLDATADYIGEEEQSGQPSQRVRIKGVIRRSDANAADIRPAGFGLLKAVSVSGPLVEILELSRVEDESSLVRVGEKPYRQPKRGVSDLLWILRNHPAEGEPIPPFRAVASFASPTRAGTLISFFRDDGRSVDRVVGIEFPRTQRLAVEKGMEYEVQVTVTPWDSLLPNGDLKLVGTSLRRVEAPKQVVQAPTWQSAEFDARFRAFNGSKVEAVAVTNQKTYFISFDKASKSDFEDYERNELVHVKAMYYSDPSKSTNIEYRGVLIFRYANRLCDVSAEGRQRPAKDWREQREKWRSLDPDNPARTGRELIVPARFGQVKDGGDGAVVLTFENLYGSEESGSVRVKLETGRRKALEAFKPGDDVYLAIRLATRRLPDSETAGCDNRLCRVAARVLWVARQDAAEPNTEFVPLKDRVVLGL